ncbi:hypothetical protein B296_00037568 [Ensete ventricosum]|uniref:Uncharacterized protein n=1 Tax=Ensete ventricosum TaxID=4639 RepID=A0A426ZLL1_ENSVE|nr:hypothetical protein B296_00037568 [Ensete ventricosum]
MASATTIREHQVDQVKASPGAGGFGISQVSSGVSDPSRGLLHSPRVLGLAEKPREDRSNACLPYCSPILSSPRSKTQSSQIKRKLGHLLSARFASSTLRLLVGFERGRGYGCGGGRSGVKTGTSTSGSRPAYLHSPLMWVHLNTVSPRNPDSCHG